MRGNSHTNLGGYGYEGKGGLNSSLSLLGTLLGERGDSPAAIWRDAERGKLRFPLRKNQKPSVFRRLLILWSGRREISRRSALRCTCVQSPFPPEAGLTASLPKGELFQFPLSIPPPYAEK